jgi:hypothetical protein
MVHYPTPRWSLLQFMTNSAQYLALQTGQVVFGGIEKSLYTGPLVALPIVPSPDGFRDLRLNGPD